MRKHMFKFTCEYLYAIVHNVFSEDTADVVQLIKTTFRIGSRARLVYKRDFSYAPKTLVELGLLTSI